MEKMHPSSTFPPSQAPRVNGKSTVIDMTHQCPDCEFETKCTRDFGRHRMYHEEKSTHQCPWCSYSVNFAIHLTRHVKNFHTKIDMKALPSDQQVIILKNYSNKFLFLCIFQAEFSSDGIYQEGRAVALFSQRN